MTSAIGRSRLTEIIQKGNSDKVKGFLSTEKGFLRSSQVWDCCVFGSAFFIAGQHAFLLFFGCLVALCKWCKGEVDSSPKRHISVQN